MKNTLDIDIVKFIRKFTFLESRGRYYKGICPFRIGEEHGYTLTVDRKNRYFSCSECGAKGDVVDFVMKMYDIDYERALKKLDEIT